MKRKIFQGSVHCLMIVLVIFCLLPVLMLFSSSLTGEAQLIKNGYSFIPSALDVSAYKYILIDSPGLVRGYGISLLVTGLGTLVNLTFTMLFAYPLSRKDLPGRKFISFFLFFTMLFNGGLVPTYMNYTTIIGIKNTYFALLLPNLMFSAVNCIIVRTYFKGNIPSELYESARIDGASEFKIFTKMVLPLGKPILVTIGIFAGLGYWNDWMNGLYYITDQKMYSIQQLLNVMIQNIQYLTQYGQSGGENIPSIGLRMAIAFVAMLPLIILYPFLQKYFEAGITLGAVKG